LKISINFIKTHYILQMSILLTGGAGFIGSHTAVELLNDGYHVIIVDNLSNSSADTIDKIKQITNRADLLDFYHADITDKEKLDMIFGEHSIDTVIHFAAFKAVGESVSNPLKYYRNNIIGLITLLEVMNEYNVKNIIFSSSAAVYGEPESLPITEQFPTNAINPYGQTKLMGEQILRDISYSDKMKVILLRYFNPVGAHPSGLIGENPKTLPTNLFPYILDVINGDRDCLNIYGADYDTPDGTGVRDYTHIVDLALSHLAALKHIYDIDGVNVYNLGTGNGYSVLNIVDTFNSLLDQNGDNRRVVYRFVEKRPGDSEAVYADCSLARKELGWVTTKDLEQMVIDSLRFMNKNPGR